MASIVLFSYFDSKENKQLGAVANINTIDKLTCEHFVKMEFNLRRESYVERTEEIEGEYYIIHPYILVQDGEGIKTIPYNASVTHQNVFYNLFCSLNLHGKSRSMVCLNDRLVDLFKKGEAHTGYEFEIITKSTIERALDLDVGKKMQSFRKKIEKTAKRLYFAKWNCRTFDKLYSLTHTEKISRRVLDKWIQFVKYKKRNDVRILPYSDPDKSEVKQDKQPETPLFQLMSGERLLEEISKKSVKKVILAKYQENLREISICQRICKKWVIKHKLHREIGYHWPELRLRLARNLRILTGNQCSINGISYIFCGRTLRNNSFNICRFNENPKPIELSVISRKVKSGSPMHLELSRFECLFISIIRANHKFHVENLFGFSCNGLPIVMRKVGNDYHEIDVLLTKLTLRQKMGETFENHLNQNNIHITKTKRPLQMKGSIYRGISHGFNSGKYKEFESLANILTFPGNYLRNFFWVKYGHKYTRNGETLILNCLWNRPNFQPYYISNMQKFSYGKDVHI
jgi:hypothetical protein